MVLTAGQGYLEVGLGCHSIIPFFWAVDLFPHYQVVGCEQSSWLIA